MFARQQHGPLSVSVDAMTQLWWPYTGGILKVYRYGLYGYGLVASYLRLPQGFHPPTKNWGLSRPSLELFRDWGGAGFRR